MQQVEKKKSIHVLELCEAYGGGVKRQVDYLNEYIDKNVYDLTILVSSKRGSKVPSDYFVEDRMSDFPKHVLSFFKSLKVIQNLIQKNNVDIVHAHSTIAGIIIVLIKLFYRPKVRIVYTSHAYFSEVSRGPLLDKLLVLIEKTMNHFFDRVVHVSSDEESYAFNENLLNKSKSIVINNGVPDNNLVRENTGKVVFINVARCDYQKNPQLFISIAKMIVDKVENSKFIWVGDGPLLTECKNKVDILGLSKKIQFVGYSSNPYFYLQKATFFFSTSRYEGLPFSVLEAMSVKLPLILTDIVGHRSLIDGNGILMTKSESNNFQKLLADIENAIKNQEKLSKSSYDLFTKSYSVEQMIAQVQDLYKSLVYVD